MILAIIALIATPIILGIINDAREESDERSAELYLSGVELAIARRNLTEEFSPEICEIKQDGLYCDDYKEPLNVEVDGEVPTAGAIEFENNKVKAGTLTFGEKFTATIEEGKIVVGSASNEETGSNDEFVCRPATTKALAINWDGNYDPTGPEGYVNNVEVGLLASEVENKYAYGVTYLCDPGDSGAGLMSGWLHVNVTNEESDWYWTSTAKTIRENVYDPENCEDKMVYFVSFAGTLWTDPLPFHEEMGVRPVITIQKNKWIYRIIMQ